MVDILILKKEGVKIMATKKIIYKEYKYLLNIVAYKTIALGNTFKHREKYSVSGKKVKYKKILNRIKKNGKNYTANKYVARFVEKLIIDHKKYDFLPSSISTDELKITRADYIDMIQRVMAYRKKHALNPKEIKINYSPIIKKYGHATRKGCNNMGQNNSVKCGPHSMQECIRNLTGKVISQEQLASWAGTGSGGTDHQGLETAIRMAALKLNVNLSVKWYNFSELGWDGVAKILNSKNQDCIIHNLYRNQWGHYEVANEVNDSNINVQNSLGDKCNDGCYCGYIEYRTKAEFKSYISGISQKSVMVITNG